jgi:hypothetical protein
MSTPPRPAVLELDRDASLLLDLLVEVGHLDDAALDRVNDRLLDVQARAGTLDLQAVRRVAAEVIFESRPPSDPDARRDLDVEWSLLFH